MVPSVVALGCTRQVKSAWTMGRIRSPQGLGGVYDFLGVGLLGFRVQGFWGSGLRGVFGFLGLRVSTLTGLGAAEGL